MPERLVPQLFMQAPKEVRDYLGHMWKIPLSGGSEVVDGVQTTDGHTYDDLKIITRELMNEYNASEETFLRAWELTVSHAMTDLYPPEVQIGKKDEEEIIVEEIVEVVVEEDIHESKHGKNSKNK